MSAAQLKTLKLEIRIPYSDTPYFLQLHSSSTVNHLKSKLFRKTSSLQGRKLDSYTLAVKRLNEEAYDALHEEKKVVKSHPFIEDEYHKNKLVTLFLVRSVDLNNDLSPKSLINRGTSETLLRSAPLTSPARFSIIVPPNPFPLTSETALSHAQSLHGVASTAAPFSPPSHTLLVRSKSEPTMRRSLSNSLTNLPIYQVSSPPSDYSSLLSNSATSNLEYGMGSETGSEPLSSHCDSDTESLEELDDDSALPLATIAPMLPSPPLPPTDQTPQAPQSPTLARPRSLTIESSFKSNQKNSGKVTKSDKNDKTEAGIKDKKREKNKVKHSWWSRKDDKEKETDKDKDNKTKEMNKDVNSVDASGKRLSIKIPHLHHAGLSHAPAPGHSGHPTNLPTDASSLSLRQSTPQSGNSPHTEPSLTGSMHNGTPFALLGSTSPPNALVNSPPSQHPTSPQQTITPPLTPTPARTHVSKIKFHAQSPITGSLPPPPTPPKFSPMDNDLSNKRGNPGLIVEEDQSGKLVIVAGVVDELICCLADRDIPDRPYCDVFMCTLQYFTSMEHVLKKLIERYEYQGEDPSFAQWRPMIQTRVLKVLRSALESHEYLFNKDPALLADLRRFLESVRHSHPNKTAVREFDSLLKIAPQTNSHSHSPSQTLHRTGSGSHTVAIPVGGAKPSAGSSHPTLTRSSSSTFISLTSSHGSSSSSSIGSNNSNSPNNSPESLTLILSSVADPSLTESDTATKVSDTDSTTSYRNSVTDLATHGKTASIPHFGPSHSQTNLLVPPSASPPFRQRRDSIVSDLPPPLVSPPTTKKNKNSKLILKVRPIDMAKQLTLLEKEMFCKITPPDLMMAAWKKKDKAQAAPNVMRIIEWFNKIAAWAQTVVVVTGNLRERIGVLSRIIQIAEHCIELHNYSTGMELVSGLRCSSVSRLSRTWKGLGKKEMIAWEQMSEIFDAQGNFSTYRRLIHLAHGEPALPYLGVVLQDLLMVEELPTLLQNRMVNFKKMRRFASLLREEIQDRQTAAARYTFEQNTTIHEYFSHFAPLSDADLYKWSRICEPANLV